MAKLYDENFNKSLMSFGKSFSRLNGQPLDDSSVYFSYEEAVAYAASEAAYVGQPIAVIDKVKNTAKLYLIENSAGSLQEIGANVEFEDTNTTYSLCLARDEENKGTKITFISSNEEEENIEFFIPDAYNDSELVARVDDLEEKASAKAEQSYVEEELSKKANSNDVYTKEQVNEELAKKADADDVYTIDEIDGLLDDKADAANVYTKNEIYTKAETDVKIGEAVAAADHLKRVLLEAPASGETAENIIDAWISTNKAEKVADQYIYMIPTGLQESDNKYREYIVILNGEERYVEQVGNWEVDLSDYVTKKDASVYAKSADVENTLKDYSTTSEITDILEDYVTEQELSLTLGSYATKEELPTDYVSDEEIKAYDTAEVADGKYAAKEETANALADRYTKDEVDEVIGNLYSNEKIDELLNKKVNISDATAEDGLRFINQTEINKLSKLNLDGEDITISGSVNASQVKELYPTVVNIIKGSASDLDPDAEGNQLGLGIEEGAQVNKIDSVDVEFSIDENKKLGLVKVPVGKLEGLSDEFEITDNSLGIKVISATKITNLNTAEFAIADGKLGIVAVDVNKITGLADNYVSKTIYAAEVGTLSNLVHATGNENSTLVDEVNFINQRLTWQEMSV